MKVTELNRAQLVELKCNYICMMNAENSEGPSCGELAAADDIISDDEIIAAYDGITFSPDDFCN